jgi:hypothetical protein
LILPVTHDGPRGEHVVHRRERLTATREKADAEVLGMTVGGGQQPKGHLT